MENMWARFNDIAKPEDVMEAKSDFDTTEPGIYKVTLEGIEAGVNKSDLPMLKARFRDKTSNKLIFFNHNLQVPSHQWITDKNIAEAVVFVSAMTGEDYEFTGLSSMAKFINEMPNEGEFTIEVSYGDHDPDQKFAQVKIVVDKSDDEISDDFMKVDGLDDEDMPF